MTENTVWMVTSGTYSDYGVVAIYATEELANRAVEVLAAQRYAEDARVEPMLLRHSLDLIHEGHYLVPVKRRSGEPTVTRTWSPSYLSADDGLTEQWVTHLGMGKYAKTPRHVVYRGESSAAFACARAMSYALHGEVVLADELRDTPQGPQVLDKHNPQA